MLDLLWLIGTFVVILYLLTPSASTGFVLGGIWYGLFEMLEDERYGWALVYVGLMILLGYLYKDVILRKRQVSKENKKG
jgi:hypothetical protein